MNQTPNSNNSTEISKPVFTTGKIILLVILVLLLLSPYDIIPDILPVVSQIDKIDDIGYVAGIGKMIYDVIKQKKAQKNASQNPPYWDV